MSAAASPVSSKHLGQRTPTEADLGPGAGEPTKAVATVEKQVTIALDGHDVGLAITGEVTSGEHLGQRAPTDADPGPGTGEPTKAVATVEKQVTIALDGHDVGLAITGEVTSGEHLGQRAPTDADPGPGTGEPTKAVATVEKQVTIALDGHDVGLAITGEVTSGEHLGQRAPTDADPGPGTGEPTKAVATVEKQVTIALDGHDVGLAITGEVTSGEHLGQRAPTDADPGPGTGEPTKAVATVEKQVTIALDGHDVGLAITGEVTSGEHLGQRAPTDADPGPGTGEPTKAVATVEKQVTIALDGHDVGLAITGEVTSGEHLGQRAPTDADPGPGTGEPTKAVATVEKQVTIALDGHDVGLAITGEVTSGEHLGQRAPTDADPGPGTGEPTKAVATVEKQVTIALDGHDVGLAITGEVTSGEHLGQRAPTDADPG